MVTLSAGCPSKWTWISCVQEVNSTHLRSCPVPVEVGFVTLMKISVYSCSVFTWQEAHFILELTVEGRTKGHHVHQHHLTSEPLFFPLGHVTTQQSPLMMLANGPPSTGGTVPVTRRYTSYMKHGTRTVFLSIRKLFCFHSPSSAFPQWWL